MQAKANGLSVRDYANNQGYDSMASPITNGHFNMKNNDSPSHEFLPDVSAVGISLSLLGVSH